MVVIANLPQHSQHCNFTPITPRHGVVTLTGYGIRLHIERGHLIIQDGVADQRRQARFARVGHGLRRLVIIGSDGSISLAAIRWLARQSVSLAIIERNGSVLATTGPVRPSDSRLRRAQALAENNGTALQLGICLIDEKLA